MSEIYDGSNAGPIVTEVTLPTDGDDVNATSVNTVLQPLTDNDAYAKRVFPDLLTGGDYRALTAAPPQLLIGNPIAIDRHSVADTTSAIYVAGASAAAYCVEVYASAAGGVGVYAKGNTTGDGIRGEGGATGAGGGFVGGSTAGAGIEAAAQAGNSNGGTFTGHGSGTGLSATAGASGIGVVATGGGAGAGLSATAGGTAGTPSIRGIGGPLKLDTYIAAPTTQPGGLMWPDAFVRARGAIVVVSAGPTVGPSAKSYNIASAVFSDAVGGGNFNSITVTLAEGMGTANDWEVHIAPVRLAVNTPSDFYQPVPEILTSATFKIWVPSTIGTGSWAAGQIVVNSFDARYQVLILGRF